MPATQLEDFGKRHPILGCFLSLTVICSFVYVSYYLLFIHDAEERKRDADNAYYSSQEYRDKVEADILRASLKAKYSFYDNLKPGDEIGLHSSVVVPGNKIVVASLSSDLNEINKAYIFSGDAKTIASPDHFLLPVGTRVKILSINKDSVNVEVIDENVRKEAIGFEGYVTR